MFYVIYQTRNLINNKIYIGKHQTKNINDSYLGSGKILELAIKKYGKHNFKKEILFVFDEESKMNEKEKELVSEAYISSNGNYNAMTGGEGGPAFKGKKHSEETKRKISEQRKGTKLSIEARQKISESNSRRKLSPETKKKLSDKAKLRMLSLEEKNKISESLKKYHQNKNIAG
jgi:group I intron endonuclease